MSLWSAFLAWWHGTGGTVVKDVAQAAESHPQLVGTAVTVATHNPQAGTIVASALEAAAKATVVTKGAVPPPGA